MSTGRVQVFDLTSDDEQTSHGPVRITNEDFSRVNRKSAEKAREEAEKAKRLEQARQTVIERAKSLGSGSLDVISLLDDEEDRAVPPGRHSHAGTFQFMTPSAVQSRLTAENSLQMSRASNPGNSSTRLNLESNDRQGAIRATSTTSNTLTSIPQRDISDQVHTIRLPSHDVANFGSARSSPVMDMSKKNGPARTMSPEDVFRSRTQNTKISQQSHSRSVVTTSSGISENRMQKELGRSTSTESTPQNYTGKEKLTSRITANQHKSRNSTPTPEMMVDPKRGHVPRFLNVTRSPTKPIDESPSPHQALSDKSEMQDAASDTQSSKLYSSKNASPKLSKAAKVHTGTDTENLPTPALTPGQESPSVSDLVEQLDTLAEPKSEVLLHVSAIEVLLAKHREMLSVHQEALVSCRLLESQQQHLSFHGPKRVKSDANVFDNLFPLKKSYEAPTKEERQSKLMMQTSAVASKPAKKPPAVYFTSYPLISNAQSVPKVRSIGRLGVSRDLLSRNVQTLNHMPWFPENEMETATQGEIDRYEELQARYNDSINIRSLQRRCRAKSQMWRPQMKKFLSDLGIECGDVLYYMLHDDETEKPASGTLTPEMERLWYERAEDCPSCVEDTPDSAKKEDCRSPDWRKVAGLIARPPTERRLAMAGLLCEVFYRKIKMNVWHVVAEMESAVQLKEKLLKEMQTRKTSTKTHMDTFCCVCGQFSCVVHGAYEDEESSNDDSILSRPQSLLQPDGEADSTSDSDSSESSSLKVVLDDAEASVNVRKHATLPLRLKSSGAHTCGVFCFDTGVSVNDIIGLQPDGSIRGAIRQEMLDVYPTWFDESKVCGSPKCFWDVTERSDTDFKRFHQQFKRYRSQPLFRDPLDVQTWDALLPTALTSKRGPCELAKTIPSEPCLSLFYMMLCSLRTSPHSVSGPSERISMNRGEQSVLSKSRMAKHSKSFAPCSHPGPCNSSACSCILDNASCESSCVCSTECEQRFKGCKCSDGRRKVCFEDARCECWANHRECDPSLCLGCGVQEVLDPVNRANDPPSLSCRNNRIQLGIPKRTCMGISEVHGWGLYAGENIAKSEFISEYKGELIGIAEGNRRGAVYHNVGLEYLFKLGNDQELDGSRFSNKARFINNSSLAKNINVVAAKVLCNGITRIMLYATRDILAGEELFYDYGYHKVTRANFKEKPEPIKKTILSHVRSTASSLVISSTTTSTTRSVLSEPPIDSVNNEQDLDEREEFVPPDSDPESDFEFPHATQDGDSEDEETADQIRSSLGAATPTGVRRKASRDVPQTKSSLSQTFSSMHTHRDSRENIRSKQPRFKLNSPKPPSSQSSSAFDSDSDMPIARASSIRKKSSSTELSKLAMKRVPDHLRKRRISSTDRRFGGEIQRKAAATRKARLEAEAKAVGVARGGKNPGMKRRKDDFPSSPTQPSGSSRSIVNKRIKLTQPRRPAHRNDEASLLTAAGPSRRIESAHSPSESVSMSESSRSPSPHRSPAFDMAQLTSSFESGRSKKHTTSDFETESTQSIPHSSPQKSQTLDSASGKEKQRKELLTRVSTRGRHGNRTSP